MNRAPKALELPADAAMYDIARRIRDRVKDNRSQTKCGSFVFVTPERHFFVMRESSVASIRMADEQFSALVGLYAANPRDGSNASVPSIRELMADLAEHFRLMGLVCAGADGQ